MSKKSLEINVYSLESAINANLAGADRIELCSSMWEGGCTPSQGMIQAIQEKTTIPIHAMLRPRGGDFTYSDSEKYVIQKELDSLMEVNVSGIVTGILNPAGKLDKNFIKILLKQAPKLEWTFHRAIDMTLDTEKVILELQDLGFTRILTSGKHNKAIDGLANLEKWVNIPNRTIQIMAGSGVSPENMIQFLSIGVDAVHMSAKRSRDSKMVFRNNKVSMGGSPGISEYLVYYSDLEIINKSVKILNKFNKN